MGKQKSDTSQERSIYQVASNLMTILKKYQTEDPILQNLYQNLKQNWDGRDHKTEFKFAKDCRESMLESQAYVMSYEGGF